MTRKHFVRIAAILRQTKTNKVICYELAAEFKLFNAAFNRERFMAACGH